MKKYASRNHRPNFTICFYISDHGTEIHFLIPKRGENGDGGGKARNNI
jgi:hypothetical protein